MTINLRLLSTMSGSLLVNLWEIFILIILSRAKKITREKIFPFVYGESPSVLLTMKQSLKYISYFCLLLSSSSTQVSWNHNRTPHGSRKYVSPIITSGEISLIQPEKRQTMTQMKFEINNRICPEFGRCRETHYDLPLIDL